MKTPSKEKKKTEKSSGKRPLTFWVVFLAIVFFDQLVKYLVRTNFVPGSSNSVIGSILSFTYVNNTGISFGLLKGMNLLFIIVSFLALALFDYIYMKNRKYGTQLAVICAGIAGNLIDRLTLGYVVDFIDFHFWPVFNLADSAISLGILWLVFMLIKNKDDLI